MRRDKFTVSVRTDATGTDNPALDIEYTGETDTIAEQFTGDGGVRYETDEIDAAFRLQGPREKEDVTGVFSLTHRVTGDYLLEVNVDAERILDLVRIARDTDDDTGSYHVHVEGTDADIVHHELDSLLVYDSDGNLLRQHSLIPSGVEL